MGAAAIGAFKLMLKRDETFQHCVRAAEPPIHTILPEQNELSW